MKVPYDEGSAHHIGPESCAFNREVVSEALTGESAGQVLSHEKGLTPGRRRYRENRKTIQDTPLSRGVCWSRVVVDPVHARKLPAREPGDPMPGLGRWRQGPRCESQGSTIAMNGRGKSDRPIDTAETAEQRRVRLLLAEAVEGRGLTKRNPFRQNKFWAQDQERTGHEG
jgi:hypothetical protein